MNGDQAECVGRQAELAALEQSTTNLAAGQGGAVIIEGEPGIGKSTLLDAALNRTPPGCEVLRGQCDELRQRFPLLVITGLLGVSADSADTLRRQAALALEQPEAATGWKIRAGSGDPVAAAVEHLLSLVDRLCARAPLVLVLEDLHWADEPTLLLWKQLCQASTQQPLLVIGTRRAVPERADLDLVQREVLSLGGVVMDLPPLPGDSVRTLAAHILGGYPGPQLTEQLGLAAGNPLYIVELIDSLSRRDVLRSADGIVEIRESTAMGGNVSLAGFIGEKLEFLSQKSRETLRAAALLGPSFSVTNLTEIVRQSPDFLTQAVQEAIAAGVLEPVGTRLRFRHGLLKESLYQATPTGVRGVLQRRAAEALIESGATVEQVAEIILRSLETVDGWEVDWLTRNARTLAWRVPLIAVELIEHALKYTDAYDPRYVELQDHLTSACFLLGRYDQAKQLTQAILLHTVDPHRIGQATWLSGRIALRQGDEEELERFAALSDPRLEPVWQARVRGLQAETVFALGRHTEAWQRAADVLAEAEQLGDSVATAWALHVESLVLYRRHEAVEMLAAIDRALELAENDHQLSDIRLVMLGNRAAALDKMGRSKELSEAMRAARRYAEKIATPNLSLIVLQLSSAFYDAGNWDEAVSDIEDVTGLPAYWEVQRLGMLALIAARRDEWTRATEYLHQLKSVSVPEAMWQNMEFSLMAQSLAQERAGRPDEAVAILAEAMKPQYAEYLVGRPDLCPALVRLALDAGDQHIARTAVLVAQQSADEDPDPRGHAIAGWCHGIFDTNPAPILAAAASLRDNNLQCFLGDMLQDAAAAQATNGDIADAHTTLSKALSVYADLGADWDARRAVARLRSLGVVKGVSGRRRRASSGWGALTGTEVQVARLAARGLSNPDIAIELLLSRRTVESHMSHILGKLQVRSRKDISRVAKITGHISDERISS